MRRELKRLNGVRQRFQATVSRFGRKRAFKGPDIPTLLLVDVKAMPEGHFMADHIWVTCGKSWIGMMPGDVIEFDARVSRYEKGYKGRRLDIFNPVSYDYRLERPTHITRVHDGITILKINSREI